MAEISNNNRKLRILKNQFLEFKKRHFYFLKSEVLKKYKIFGYTVLIYKTNKNINYEASTYQE